ncbi:MAG: hypothetical protein WA628_25905 [Terriglobales bacterium]
MALRERLAALNPARTVTLSGAQRPAVVVLENEMPTAAELLRECFYLEWGASKVVEPASGHRAVCGMECRITYWTSGSVESGVDRGRVLGQLDRELFMICQPTGTGKRDFSQSPNVDLGIGIFWTLPSIDEMKPSPGETEQDRAMLSHRAKVTVFFFPEVEPQ